MTDNARFWSKTPWRPLPDIVHAVCIRHFDASGHDDLTLQLGDELYITEVNGRENQWCRGWLLTQPSVAAGPSAPRAYAGIFPRCCVSVREVLADGEEPEDEQNTKVHSRSNSTPTTTVNNRAASHEGSVSPPKRQDSPLAPLVPRHVSPRSHGDPRPPAPLPALRVGDDLKTAREPLIDDISSTIREWHSSRLQGLAMRREYTKLDELSTIVDRLSAARRQLALNLLTERETRALREQVVWDLVKGNKMVEGEVIVRSATQNGRTLTATDSLPELADLQTIMSLRDRPVAAPREESHLSHLLMQVKAAPQNLQDPALLHMCLYAVSSSARPKPVSEAFAVELAIAEGSGRVEIADRFNSTLFAELNKVDAGGGDQSDSRLYLICRLVHDAPLHVATAAFPSSPVSPMSPHPDYEDRPRNRNSWVRSRSRKGSSSDDRPSTGLSSVSAMTRSTSTNRAVSSQTATAERPAAGKRTRRVAGWAAVSVSSLLRDRGSETLSLSFWVPSVPGDFSGLVPSSGEDGWDDVIKSMARSASGSYSKLPLIGPLMIDLKAFAHPDVRELIKNRPSLLKDVHCTPSISLNGASNQERSDIYLTLRDPALPPRAKTFHPQHGTVHLSAATDLLNLQVTLEVRRSNGERIDDAIHPTGNRQPHTAFRSNTIERGESWNQTIKLSIDPSDLPHAHIIMSIADGAGFPFALAWLPLWDRVNGFPSDGQQNLALWDYCEFTANTIDGKGAYQSLPARVEEMPDLHSAQMASIAIETHLCSTSATQNADVLAFSNLDHIDKDDTAELLDRFQYIPDEEIAKFFGPILVSLDSVLERCASDDDIRTIDGIKRGRKVSDSAVKCLAHTVRLVRDRRYFYLQAMMDEYISKRKSTINSSVTILRSLRAMLASPFDARGGRELRACVKVMDIMLRFALGAAPKDHSDRLRKQISEFLQDIDIILMANSQFALPSQAIIMQNMHSWIPEILKIYPEEDTMRFIAHAIDSCARENTPLWLHRLSMIHNVFEIPQFRQGPLCLAMVELTENWLALVWPTSSSVNDTAISAVRLSVTIIRQQQKFMRYAQRQRYTSRLFSVFQLIYKSKSTTAISSTRRRAFSPLFQTSHPFRSVSTTAEFIPQEVLLEITAVLGAFFQMDQEAPEQDDEIEPPNLLEALSVIRALQDSAAFPASWLSLSVSMSRCTVSMLGWILDHLIASLPDENEDDGEAVLDFDSTVWTQWFDSMVTLVTSDVVRMEEHSEQKRRAVWVIGGDIRESAASLIERAWDSLGWPNEPEIADLYGIDRMGGYQVQFTSELIPSVVSLGLSLHLGIRTVAVRTLQSMIIGEWELSGELDVIRCALIDALDKAFRDDRFEPGQANVFLDTIRAQMQYLADTEALKLHSEVESMVAELHTIVEVLTRIRDSAADDAMRLQYRVLMLEHLRTANNEDSYLRNIHDIAEAQVERQNYSSAALAMQLHIELLDKTTDPQNDYMTIKAYPEIQLPSQTVYQRRQMLHTAMIKFYRKGCCWSRVLSTLEKQKEEMLAAYDTANLAVVLHELADLYQKLSSGKGMQLPRYFKVAFSDHADFPSTVSGRSFVFETQPDDDTAHFARRLKHAYPTATIIHSGVTSSASSSEAAKINVISVHVNRDHLHDVNQRPGVSPFFRLFTLTKEPGVFSNSTRQQKPGLSVAQQTVAKNIYVTAERFPTLLGRAEIIREEAQVLTAAQAASDRVQRKTVDLAEALLKAVATETDENDKVAQIVKASVDPTSIDSVAAYHELLLEDETASVDMSINDGASTQANGLPSHADGPAAADKEAHMRVLTVSLRDHAQMLEHALATAFDHRPALKQRLRQEFELTFEPELHSLYPEGDWMSKSAAWEDTRPRPPPMIRQKSLFDAETPPPPPVEVNGGAGMIAVEQSKLTEKTPANHRRFHSAPEGARPSSRSSRRGLGAAESDNEESGWRGLRRKLSLKRRDE